MTLEELGSTVSAPEPAYGPVPKRCKFDTLMDPTVMTEMLYRAESLTDEAYSELVNDIGWRAALLVLRAKALGGDVRALDLYLRLCKDDKRERAERSRPLPAPLGATTFASGPRSDTTTGSAE